MSLYMTYNYIETIFYIWASFLTVEFVVQHASAIHTFPLSRSKRSSRQSWNLRNRAGTKWIVATFSSRSQRLLFHFWYGERKVGLPACDHVMASADVVDQAEWIKFTHQQLLLQKFENLMRAYNVVLKLHYLVELIELLTLMISDWHKSMSRNWNTDKQVLIASSMATRCQWVKTS